MPIDTEQPGDALWGAVEGGGSKFLCALSDATGREHARITLPTGDADATLAAVCAFFAPFRPRLRGLGVACFGPLALSGPERGSLLRTPKPGWSGTPLRRRLADALGVPVEVDTDVNGALRAEARWGALAGLSHGVYITVGTGVGVGAMVDGRIVYGRMHPELGHLRSHDPSFAGVCAFHGSCVEGLISAPALRARGSAAPEALSDDDPLWPKVAATLAELLQSVALAYAPERIVLGGGVLARRGLREAAAAALVASLGGYLPWAELADGRVADFVAAPVLGPRAGLCGAYALAGLTALPVAAPEPDP
jgi:fructokinase